MKHRRASDDSKNGRHDSEKRRRGAERRGVLLGSDHAAFVRKVCGLRGAARARGAHALRADVNYSFYDELSLKYSEKMLADMDGAMIYRMLGGFLSLIYLRLFASVSLTLISSRPPATQAVSQSLATKLEMKFLSWRSDKGRRERAPVKRQKAAGDFVTKGDLVAFELSLSRLLRELDAAASKTTSVALAQKEAATADDRWRDIDERLNLLVRSGASASASDESFARSAQAGHAADAFELRRSLSSAERVLRTVSVEKHTSRESYERDISTQTYVRDISVVKQTRNILASLAERYSAVVSKAESLRAPLKVDGTETSAAVAGVERTGERAGLKFVLVRVSEGEKERGRERSDARTESRLEVVRASAAAETPEASGDAPARRSEGQGRGRETGEARGVETESAAETFVDALNIFGGSRPDARHAPGDAGRGLGESLAGDEGRAVASSAEMFGRDVAGRFVLVSNVAGRRALDELVVLSKSLPLDVAARTAFDARPFAHRRAGAGRASDSYAGAEGASGAGAGELRAGAGQLRAAAGELRAAHGGLVPGAASVFRGGAEQSRTESATRVGTYATFVRSLALFMRGLSVAGPRFQAASGDWGETGVHASQVRGDAPAQSFFNERLSSAFRWQLAVGHVEETTRQDETARQAAGDFAAATNAPFNAPHALVGRARASQNLRRAPASTRASDASAFRAIDGSTFVTRVENHMTSIVENEAGAPFFSLPADVQRGGAAQASPAFGRQRGRTAALVASQSFMTVLEREAGARERAGEALEDEAGTPLEAVASKLTALRREVTMGSPRFNYVFAQTPKPQAVEHPVVEKVEEKKLAEIVKNEVQTLIRGGATPVRLSRADYATIAEQVYSALVRRLVVERERLGPRTR